MNERKKEISIFSWLKFSETGNREKEKEEREGENKNKKKKKCESYVKRNVVISVYTWIYIQSDGEIKMKLQCHTDRHCTHSYKQCFYVETSLVQHKTELFERDYAPIIIHYKTYIK